MSDIRTKRLARLIVNYSIGVKEKQLIQIRSSTAANALVQEVYREILEAGGRPWLDLSFPGKDYIHYTFAKDYLMTELHPVEPFFAEHCDGLVAVDCSPNSRELSNVDHARVALARKTRQPVRDIWDRREAEGKFKWVVVGYPVDSMAQDALMSTTEYTDFVYAACGCDLEDPVAYWKEQSAKMKAAHRVLEGSKKMRIVGEKTDLTLSVDGRLWKVCDGQCNMPDGEIFTSPIEESAEGEVFFDIPTTYNGVEAGGIHLKLKEGRIVSSTAEKGEAFIHKMFDMDAGSRLIGEVAFGMNEFIQKPSKNILFDEKIGGSMHLAVGASYPETGGKNKSGLHWDMVKNMKNGGYVELDGRRIYENGKFRL